EKSRRLFQPPAQSVPPAIHPGAREMTSHDPREEASCVYPPCQAFVLWDTGKGAVTSEKFIPPKAGKDNFCPMGSCHSGNAIRVERGHTGLINCRQITRMHLAGLVFVQFRRLELEGKRARRGLHGRCFIIFHVIKDQSEGMHTGTFALTG